MSNVDFGSTRNEIIERALRQCGVIGENQNATAYQIQKGSRALNGVVKTLGLNNQFLFRCTEATFSTVASTQEYTPAEGILGVKSAFIRVDSTDRFLLLPSYQAWYASETQKSSEGFPESLIWKDNAASPTILLSPVPNDAWTVHYMAVYKLKDFDNASDANLFPSHWEEMLVWNLAAALSFEYGLPLQERTVIMAQAKQLKDDTRLDNWNHNSPGDIMFEPS